MTTEFSDEVTSVAVVARESRESREGRSTEGTPSEQLERLRAAWVVDIDLLEKMGQEVINLRRRFREALQQLDILIQRNASLEATNAALEAARMILESAVRLRDERITSLEAELAAVLGRMRHA